MKRLLGLAILALTACATDTQSPDPIPPIEVDDGFVYSKHRDGNGRIAPVLPEGTGFDAGDVDSPSVIHDPDADPSYLLYYEASNASGDTRIAMVGSNTPDLQTLDVPRRIAVDLGGPGSGYNVAATDPSVVVDTRVAAAGGLPRYQMWFEGRSGPGGAVSTILRATSLDGQQWTGFTPCTGLDPSFGSAQIADPMVVLHGDVYKMWFEARTTVNGTSLFGYAESNDGVSWLMRDAAGNTGAAAEAVFAPGEGHDAHNVEAPSVAITEDAGLTTYYMWYEASDRSSSTVNTIGFAQSTDGLTWSRTSKPVLAPTPNADPEPFDSADVSRPGVLLDATVDVTEEGYFLLWYTGDAISEAINRIGLARGRVVITPTE